MAKIDNFIVNIEDKDLTIELINNLEQIKKLLISCQLKLSHRTLEEHKILSKSKEYKGVHNGKK